MTQGEGKDPTSFLGEIIGNMVTVKLNSGVIYKGEKPSKAPPRSEKPRGQPTLLADPLRTHARRGPLPLRRRKVLTLIPPTVKASSSLWTAT